MRLTPASRHMSTWRRASPTPVEPTFANPPVPPKVIVPKVSTETRSPDLPSVRYSTGETLSTPHLTAAPVVCPGSGFPRAGQPGWLSASRAAGTTSSAQMRDWRSRSPDGQNTNAFIW